MSEHEMPQPGRIFWHDLTVDDAETIRDFYQSVVGWRPVPVDMGGYSDYNMMTGDDEAPTAGICHARGEIAGIPPQWLAYTVVPDIDASMTKCRDLGGKVVWGPSGDGTGGRMCVIQDPAGAVMAILQTA